MLLGLDLTTPHGVHALTLTVAAAYITLSWSVFAYQTSGARPSVAFILKAIGGGVSVGAGVVLVCGIVDPAILVALGSTGAYLVTAAIYAIVLPMREIGLDEQSAPPKS